MKDLPFTFRDFIMYFVPGIILLFNITIILGVLGLIDVNYILNTILKNQFISTVLLVINAYTLGLMINDKSIFNYLPFISNFSKKIESELENNLKIYSNRKETIHYISISFFKQNNTYTHYISDQFIPEDMTWVMIRQLESKNNQSILSNIDRINSLRNFTKQIIHVILYSIVIIIFMSIFMILPITIKHIIPPNPIYLLLFFILNLIFLYLSYRRFITLTNWFIRIVLITYYINFCQEKLQSSHSFKENFMKTKL